MRIRARLGVAGVGLSLVLTGCGGPEPVAAPPGDESFTCSLPSDDGDIAISLVLPDDSVRTHSVDAEEGDEDTCAWSSDEGASPTFVAADQTDYATLADQRDDEAELVGVQGDDEISDLVYEDDVPVFGTTGERLQYRCFCDGDPKASVAVQADGVQASYYGPADDLEELERRLDEVVSTVRIG